MFKMRNEPFAASGKLKTGGLLKLLLLTGFIVFSVSFSLLPVQANDAIFDSSEQAVEIYPSSTAAPSSYTGSGNAELSEGVNGSIQKSSFRDAISSLEAAEVEIREEYAVYTQRYNEAKGRYDVANAECKALKKSLKEINNKMKTVERTKKMIFSSLPR